MVEGHRRANKAPRRGAKRIAAEDGTVRRFFLDMIIGEMKGDIAECRRVLARFQLRDNQTVSPYATYSLKSYVAFFEEAARCSRHSPSQIFDPRSTASGFTTLTRMPASAPSSARQRARWISAAFAVQ